MKEKTFELGVVKKNVHLFHRGNLPRSAFEECTEHWDNLVLNVDLEGGYRPALLDYPASLLFGGGRNTKVEPLPSSVWALIHCTLYYYLGPAYDVDGKLLDDSVGIYLENVDDMEILDKEISKLYR